jgi:ABC-type multidrug transport system ATPase subunit
LLDGGCDFYHGIEQLIGYARKTEHFQTACTPREALRFAAAMRAPAKWSKQDKRDHCENVLGQLGLLDCADKLIETLEPLERKLTHIGVELTIKPRLLVVEEANGGGLTPDESLILVTRLAELTWMQDQKMNIIVSFNHASSEVFHKMTKVMVTSPAGQLFYGTPDKLSQQLEGCGYENCHTHLDAIELAKGMQKERLEELCVKMKGNKSWTRVDMDVAFYRAYNPHFYIMMETAARHQQICGIICRQVRTMWRKKLALAMSFFLPAILNILLLLIVSKVDGALNRDVRVGDVVLVCFGGMLAAAQPMIWRTQYDREQFFDEYCHGCYEVRSFLWAKLAVELPQTLVQAAIASFASHYFFGLTGFVPAYILTITILGLVFTSTSFCLAQETRCKNLGGLLALLIFFPQLLFMGVFYHVSEIPDWLRWIQYVCPLKHAMNVLAHWEFVYTDEKTEVANAMQANLDLPKYWWVSVLVLAFFIWLLQVLAARDMWFRALRSIGTGRRWRSWNYIYRYMVYKEGCPTTGTVMAPPCKRTYVHMHFNENIVDV